MRLIEIKPLSNGAHRNQTINHLSVVSSGWAIIPDNMEIPDTFPFVDIEVEGGVVTAMTAGTVPEPEPIPEPTNETETADDILNILLGVSD